jgi:hypothetical protein
VCAAPKNHNLMAVVRIPALAGAMTDLPVALSVSVPAMDRRGPETNLAANITDSDKNRPEEDFRIYVHWKQPMRKREDFPTRNL